MSLALCDTFRNLAIQAFTGIGLSRAMAFQLKEESFTDLNLFTLKLHHPDEVLIKVFNRIEEGVSGADWEWWLSDERGRWIGFRVQAKIIALRADEFSHLHYPPTGRSIPQCEKLILQASANPTYPCVPVYCLYLTADAATDPAYAGTNTWLYGCSLLSAFDVRRFRATRETRLSHLWPYLKPWHVLVCPENGRPVSEHIDRLIRSYFMETDNAADKSSWIASPPPYVTELITSGEVRQSSDEKPVDLAGIMVLMARRQE